MLHTLKPHWAQILRRNFTNLESLADFLELSTLQRQQLATHRPFSLNLPYRLAAKIAKGTLDDPLLRQFVPLIDEEVSTTHFQCDPLAEENYLHSGKLLHKYFGRVLLLCTSACAMHCRYCFRQNFPYATQQKGFEKEIATISADTSIREVILSGGDPLSLSDRSLGQLLNSLAAIPHVKRIRLHTRFPIGIPERIDDSFCALLDAFPKRLWCVIHANHPSEFDDTVLKHLALLQKLGVNILHQGVLLRGVNDHVDTLATLCEMLVDNGIIPYYLHQLDRVSGAAHFEVPIEEGLQLMKALSIRLSGYALPRYAQEIPGAPSKLPVVIS